MAKNTEQTKKDYVYVNFSNKQTYNKREITNPETNQVTELASVSFPSSAEHTGYHFDVATKHIFATNTFDKETHEVNGKSEKMSTVRFVKGQQITISKGHKDENGKWVEDDKIKMSAEDVRKEFNSWRNKDKAEGKDNSQSAPEYASADNSDFEEIIDEDEEYPM